MAKKLFFLLILFIDISLYPKDKTIDTNENIFKNQKIIEFSIGGNIIHSFTLLRNQSFSVISDKVDTVYPVDFFIGQSIEASIPISVVFHPLTFFGIGIMYQTGFSGFFYNCIYPGEPISFINRIKIINKFGDMNIKKWFLLEYGINIYNGFTFYPGNASRGGILIGPSIFHGYEKIYNNKFEFTVGFDFNALYYSPSYSNDIKSYRANLNWYFDFGIEFRWKFVTLYKIKSKSKAIPTSDNGV